MLSFIEKDFCLCPASESSLCKSPKRTAILILAKIKLYFSHRHQTEGSLGRLLTAPLFLFSPPLQDKDLRQLEASCSDHFTCSSSRSSTPSVPVCPLTSAFPCCTKVLRCFICDHFLVTFPVCVDLTVNLIVTVGLRANVCVQVHQRITSGLL